MSQHPPKTEQLEERRLTEEANVIKMELSKSKGPDDKPATNLVNITFSTLAQSVIPGNFLRKRLGRQMNVEYIPDSFYIIELCQRIFQSAKNDKSLKKIGSINIHSFTLYIAHTLMYVYLKVVQDVNPPNVDLTNMLNLYAAAGFDTNKLPSVCSHWLDGIGKFQDPQTKRVFLPTLPDIGVGAVNNSGFFTANTGHLIPNTYCLASLVRIAADRSTGLQLFVAAAQHNSTGIFGTTSTAAGLTDSTLCRANALRVPGGKALGTMCSDTELISLVDVALTTAYLDPLQNLLKVTPNLLSHLKHSQAELFLEIDTVTLGPISPVGSSLAMMPLIYVTPQSLVVPARNVVETSGPPAVGTMAHHSEYDHNSRISTRNEVVNGHVDYAYQTPLVRIVNQNDAIIVAGSVYADPQPPWYLNEHEFDTMPATLNETRAQFGRRT
jgi:hypothetical protein